MRFSYRCSESGRKLFELQEEEMSNGEEWSVGEILWQDLSVKNAIEIRDFYQKIIGWDCIPEDMGEYKIFSYDSTTIWQQCSWNLPCAR